MGVLVGSDAAARLDSQFRINDIFFMKHGMGVLNSIKHGQLSEANDIVCKNEGHVESYY